jgi:hypothetical protein
MNGEFFLAIGFFIGYFTYAIVIYLQERRGNDRKEQS